jgi:hypothetical protein
MSIEEIKGTIKRNFLLYIFIVSLLLHIGEGALTAISYAESVAINTNSNLKYGVSWFFSLISFLGIAGISLACSVGIPSSIANVFRAHYKQEAVLSSFLMALTVVLLYLGVQYFFVYVNLLYAGAINSNNAIQSLNVVGFSLNATQVNNMVTVPQANTAITEVLLVYVNMCFELVLSFAFLYMELVEGVRENKPKK